MKFGVSLPHSGSKASPAAIRDVAQAAEALGFDSVWAVDHVAIPQKSESIYTMGEKPERVPPDHLDYMLPFYDCVTTMCFAAAQTEEIRVGSGIMVLPLRNPVYNAKQLATLDLMCGGRIILGVGSGWLREEAEAMQMPWDDRGVRTDEHIEVLHKLWTADTPFVSFEGQYVRFDAIRPQPRPAQMSIPVLIGGHSQAAMRRAGRLGDGWISHTLPPEKLAVGMALIRDVARDHGRDADALQWFNSWNVWSREDDIAQNLRDDLTAYAKIGLDHLQLRLFGESAAEDIATMEWLAEEILPEFRDA